MEMLQSCGESLFNEDGSVNIVDNKALKPILEIYSQMVKDGTLVEVTDWDQYIASINNGTTATTPTTVVLPGQFLPTARKPILPLTL